MIAHPPITSRPRVLWNGPRSEGGQPWREAFDDEVVGALRAGLLPDAGPMDRRALGLLPYRPDLFRRIGPAALRHSGLRHLLYRSPACALALLSGFYEETAPSLEPSLAGCGESVFHLLHWASRHGHTLRQPESFYRRTLITDSYWGFRYAQRTKNRSLLADVTRWCGDERRHHAAAAAFFLLRHPREPVAPYREVLRANPFYAYLALPRLSSRGFSVAPEDIGDQPKWACHFALSSLTARPERFAPLAARDPGWALELAAGRGWLERPDQRQELLQTLAAGDPAHPLRFPALRFLHEAALPRPTPELLWPAPAPVSRAAPPPLTLGQTAETRALGVLQIAKNTEVWRPSLQQVASPDFQKIVGPPRFTHLGRVRGTVLDSVEDGFSEIKSGSSVLNSTYQLRLQTYRAVVEDRPLKIYTNRPIDIQFGQWLGPWGVKIEPLPGPQP